MKWALVMSFMLLSDACVYSLFYISLFLSCVRENQALPRFYLVAGKATLIVICTSLWHCRLAPHLFLCIILHGSLYNLQVNATYEDVRVTNVSPEGILYCQLPSRGAARLRKSLEETEAIFTTQVEKKKKYPPGTDTS